MTTEDLKSIFGYHHPHGDQLQREIRIRKHALKLARVITEDCPGRNESKQAIFYLQIVVELAVRSFEIQESNGNITQDLELEEEE